MDRRKGGKAAGRKDGPAAGKRKRTVCLTDEASLRLDVHAACTRQDVSAVVEQLVLAHCRRFVVQDRGQAPAVVPTTLPGAEGDGPRTGGGGAAGQAVA